MTSWTTLTDFVVVEVFDDVGEFVVVGDDSHLKGILTGVVENGAIGSAEEKNSRARLLQDNNIIKHSLHVSCKT